MQNAGLGASRSVTLTRSVKLTMISVSRRFFRVSEGYEGEATVFFDGHAIWRSPEAVSAWGGVFRY